MMTASERNDSISIVVRFWATMPRHALSSSRTAPRNSQPSYFETSPSTSKRRTCSSSAYKSCCPVVAPHMPFCDAEFPEAPEVKQPFRCSVKHDAHAVKQMNNRRRRITHRFDRRLVGQKVASVNGIVKMLPRSRLHLLY